MVIEAENEEFEKRLEADNKQAILKRFEIELMLKRMDALEKPIKPFPSKKNLAKKTKQDDSDSEIELDTSPGGRPMKEYDETPAIRRLFKLGKS